jgi:hypothetical protein
MISETVAALVLGKATNHKVEVFKVFGSLIPSASHH